MHGQPLQLLLMINHLYASNNVSKLYCLAFSCYEKQALAI